MPTPNRPRQPTSHSAWQWLVTDDGSRTLWDVGRKETFHSGCGAVAETLIVYVDHSGVLSRLRQQVPTKVLEYGLGTATSFLLTASLAEHYRTPLVYTALECSLLPSEILGQLDLAKSVESCLSGGFAKTPVADPLFELREFAELPSMIGALVDAVAEWQQRPIPRPLVTRIGQFVTLQLWIGDACHWTPQQTRLSALHSTVSDANQMHTGQAAGYDAVYFDPFSPETNPELWTSEVLEVAAAALCPGGLLTSYCVKSTVRRAMQQCGMLVRKAAGPVGGKREVLVAQRPARP
ncbi:MAG: MnmC family methyltransferase [Pirellulaceae bacterium]|jgi:tRNA U34 5-methylaminomethyl-2-thiouridine-forming methyltransferase MnmC